MNERKGTYGYGSWTPTPRENGGEPKEPKEPEQREQEPRQENPGTGEPSPGSFEGMWNGLGHQIFGGSGRKGDGAGRAIQGARSLMRRTTGWICTGIGSILTLFSLLMVIGCAIGMNFELALLGVMDVLIMASYALLRVGKLLRQNAEEPQPFETPEAWEIAVFLIGCALLLTIVPARLPMLMWQTHVVLCCGLAGMGELTLGGELMKMRDKYLPGIGKKSRRRKAQPKKVQAEAPGEPEHTGPDFPGNFLQELEKLELSIHNGAVGRKIAAIRDLSRSILLYLEEQPEKRSQIRSFENYYLPTTLKLLQSYRRCESQEVRSSEVKKLMYEIEDMLDQLAEGFRKQLDQLYADEILDLSTDIDVLEMKMRQDGLSGSEFRTDKNA